MRVFPRQTDVTSPPPDVSAQPSDPSQPPPPASSDPPIVSSDPPVSPPPPEPSDPPPPSSDNSSVPSSEPPISEDPLVSSEPPPPPPSSSFPSSTPPEPSSSSLDNITLVPTPSADSSITEAPPASESLTTVTTISDGVLTTYTSAITALANPSSGGNGEIHRTALIAGLTTGLVVLLALILGGVFAYRRQARRKALEALAAKRKEKESKNLLDSEGFDDDDGGFHATRSYSTLSAPLSTGTMQRAISPAPTMIRSRASETGSIFREDVWPPPQDELVDPIRRHSSQVDLSTIIDDVMGPADKGGHSRGLTDSTVDSTTLLITHDRQLSSEPEYFQYADPFQATRPIFISQPSQSSLNPFNAPASSSSSTLMPTTTSGSLQISHAPSSSQSFTTSPPSHLPEASSMATVSGTNSSNSLHASPSQVVPRSISPTTRLQTQPKKSSPLAMPKEGNQ